MQNIYRDQLYRILNEIGLPTSPDGYSVGLISELRAVLAGKR